MTASDAFPALTPDQTERLQAVRTEEGAAAGDFLFSKGDAGDGFFAVLAGEVQTCEDAACTRPLVPGPSRAGPSGDVRSGSTKRVARAVGEGSVTVRSVHSRRAAPPATSTHGEPQGASAA